MSVYLGTYGYVALKRKSAPQSLAATVRPGDVTAASSRFALRIDEGTFLTGDRLYIQNQAAGNLEFIDASAWSDNTQHRDGNWYVNIDQLGGVRLYDTYAAAVTGNVANAKTLLTPAADTTVNITVQNTDYLTLGKITSFELNTNRETIDVTALSEQYRTQLSALMSGSGSLRAHWGYQATTEQSNYLLQLALRTEIGSEFDARFYLKRAEYNPEYGPNATDDEVYYELSGVVTQAGVAFSPDQIVEVTADFVTTGPIRLKVDTLTMDELLQEDSSRILLDGQVAGSILLESA